MIVLLAALIVILLVILFLHFSARAEFATVAPKKHAPKSNDASKYGKAIAEISKKNQHYKDFVALIGEPGFDVTRFDTAMYLYKQNRLSKNNMEKILASNYTLDKVGPNAY